MAAKGGNDALAAPAAARLQLEALEPRVLLTTLVGGDVFVYQDTNDNTVEVQLDGDIIVELIAAQYNTATGQIELGSMPGVIESNDLIPGRNSSNISIFNDDGADVSGNFGVLNGSLNGGIGSTVQNSTAVIGNDAGVANFASPDPDETDLQALATLDVGLAQTPATATNTILSALTGTTGALPGRGATFAFISGEVEVPPLTPDADPTTENAVFLVQIDTAQGAANHQVVARIDGAISAEYGIAPEEFGEVVVRAADFNPLDGKLYFVTEATDADEVERDHLFAINFQADAANAVESVLNLELPGGSDPPSLIDGVGGTFVSSLAFDRTADGARLVMWVTDDDGDAGGYLTELFVDPATGGVGLVDPAGTATVPPILARLVDPASVGDGDPEFLSSITGIEFFRDDALAAEQFIYLVDGDAGLLYELDILAAEAAPGEAAPADTFRLMGVTTDGDPDEPSGESIGGMSFDPTTINPFTGDPGVFFATDTETDNLIILDQRFRPTTDASTGAQLFMIYIAKGDAEEGRIRFAVREDNIIDTTDDRTVNPYSGDGGYSWEIVANEPGVETIDQQGAGGVFVGTLLLPEDDDPVNILATPGLLPNPFDGEVPDFTLLPEFYGGPRYDIDGDGSLTAADHVLIPGAQITESLWEFIDGSLVGSLIGNNLDIIGEASISSDGRFLAVVDVDGLDQNANAVGDQLAIIDLQTNTVVQGPVNVVDAASGQTLRGIQGLDFGDRDGDGVDELYAIYDTSSTGGGSAVLGTFNVDANGVFTGVFTGSSTITREASTPPSTAQTAADDVTITLRNGDTISVDLDSIDLVSGSVQSLLDLFNNDAENASGFLEVRGGNANLGQLSNLDFSRLEFIDRSTPLTVTDTGTSTLGLALGLVDPNLTPLRGEDGRDLGSQGELPDGQISSGVDFGDLAVRMVLGTPLGDLDNGSGEALFTATGVNAALTNGAGTVDFTISTRDGSSFEVDLDGAAFAALTDASTVDDLITALNGLADTASSTTLGAETDITIDAQGRLVIADTSTFDGTSEFSVTLGTNAGGVADANVAASVLGLTTTTATESTGTVARIDGAAIDSVNGNLQVSDDTPVAALLVNQGGNLVPVTFNTGADLQITGQDGVARDITVNEAGTLNDLATLGAITANFTLDLSAGNEVALTDDTAAGTAFTIDDLAGSDFVNVLFGVTGGTVTDNGAGDDVTTDVGGIVTTIPVDVAGQTFTSASPLSALFSGGSNVAGVQAFAIDASTGSGFVIDNGSSVGVTLVEFDLSSGEVIRAGQMPTLFGGITLQNAIGSMDFGGDGVLRLHETLNGRMLDVDVSNFRSDDLTALGVTVTGVQRIAIDLQDGTTDLIVDLTGVTTLQGVVDQINFVTGGDVTASVGPTSSLTLIDNTAGGGTFAIRDDIGGLAGALNFAITDGDLNDGSATTGVIQGGANFTQIQVGTRVQTSDGSLAPSIGAITFNPQTGEYLGLDNAVSIQRLSDGNEATSNESAALIRLLGDENGDEQGQSLRDFWVGGTVTGVVDISGSVESLYIGWLVTGDGGGLPSQAGANLFTDNFNVAGDIRELVTSASVGGSIALESQFNLLPVFNPGTEITVGGKLGRVVVGLPDAGFYGTLDVVNPVSFDNGLNASDLPFSEIEGNQDTSTNPVTNAWTLGGALTPNATFFAGDGRFSNDSFEAAEPLGGLRFGGVDGSDSIQVLGQLLSSTDNNDFVDYYSLGLLAGQTISIQLTGGLAVGVFDPDNRLVATNYNEIELVRKFDQLFQYTPTTAGEYRIAVADPTDNPEALFTDDGDLVDAEYELLVFGVGDLGLGGVVAGNVVGQQGGSVVGAAPPTIQTLRGDIGAIRSDTNQTAASYFSAAGNLRSIDSADDIGRRVGTLIDGAGISIFAGGDLGLVRSLLPGGHLQIVDSFVGGDIQVVDAAGLFTGRLVANGGLGVLRADAINGAGADGEEPDRFPTAIRVNADDSRDGDGVIDLIDVAGNLGNIDSGGPQIDTGFGGNVRYMRVGGEIFQDAFYAPGQFGEFRLVDGQAVTIVDDSGSEIRVTPVDTDEDLPIDDEENEAFLTYRTFGIRSGGAVLVDVKSTGGISITGNSGGTGASAEVGSIIANGLGRPVLFNNEEGGGNAVLVESTGDPVSGAVSSDDLRDLLVTIGGGINNPVDVFYIGFDDDQNGSEGERGRFTTISNNTGGEIVNIEATSIGLLSSRGNIGFGTSQGSAAAVEGFVLGDELVSPEVFQVVNDPRNGVVSGSIVTVRSEQALGNFFVTGIVNSVTANAGRVDNPDVFEGLQGAFIVADDQQSEIFNGNIFRIDVGEGILDSGSGDFARAGLFALPRVDGGTIIIGSGAIGEIVGRDAAIYGDIYATIAIGSITLTGDSVISGADILAGVPSPFTTLEFIDNTRSINIGFADGESVFLDRDLSSVSLGERLQPGLNRLTINGTGGIIGSYIGSGLMGRIDVNNGFGIFNSIIASPGIEGSIERVEVDGYGLRGTLVSATGDIRNVIATGRGEQLAVTEFSTIVRESEVVVADSATGLQFNPFSGDLVDRYNDLHRYLGTSPLTPGVTDLDTAGVIDSSIIQTGADVTGEIRAWQVLSTLDGSDFFPFLPVIVLDEFEGILASYSYINVAGRLNSLDITSNAAKLTSVHDVSRAAGLDLGTTLSDVSIAGLSVTAGELGRFTPGADVVGLNLSVSGEIRTLRFENNVLSLPNVSPVLVSSIEARGNSGQIGTLIVGGDLQADVTSRNDIRKVDIGGDLTGTISVLSPDIRGRGLGTFLLDGSLIDGGLDINGDVGRIVIDGAVGQERTTISPVPDQLLIRGDLGSFTSGKRVDGANMALDLVVLGDLRTFDVSGRFTGDVFVSGDLSRFTVRGDSVTSGGTIIGTSIGDVGVTVGGTLGSVTVTGGDVGDGQSDGNSDTETDRVRFVAGEGVGRFTVTNGSVLEDVTVSSSLGDIAAIVVRNGDYLGHAIANAGAIRSFTISGSDFGGLLTARELGRFSIAGSVLTGAEIDMEEAGSVTVGGDVQTGSRVAFERASSLRVGDDLSGVVLVEDGGGRFSLDVGRDLTGQVFIGGDASVSVRGDFTSDVSLPLSTPLTDLGIEPSVGSTIEIQLRDGSPAVQVNLAGVNTLAQLIERIETTVPFVSVAIDSDQEGLVLTDASPNNGATFSVSDVGSGEVALSLGIRTADGGAGDRDNSANGVIDGGTIGFGLVESTTLTSLGAQVATATDVRVTLSNGAALDISLAGATTLDEVINLLDSASAQLSAALDATGTAIELTDLTAGGTTFSVQNAVGSSMATRLGLVAADGGAGDLDGADNNVILGARLTEALVFVDGDVSRATFGGVLNGNLFASGELGRLTADAIDAGVVTAGQDIGTIVVRGDVDNALVQSGILPSVDIDRVAIELGSLIPAQSIVLFDPASGTDASRGELSSFSAANVSSSVLAAGGEFGTLRVSGAFTDSSASSGIVFGVESVRSASDDATPLNSAAEQNAARGAGGDRVLTHGDFRSATIGGAITNSSVTAGVDPGDDGAFDATTPVLAGAPAANDSNVHTSTTGGQSELGSLRVGSFDGASLALADTSIGNTNLPGGQQSLFTFTVAGIDGEAGSPIAALPGTLIGTATSGSPVVVTGASGTVIVRASNGATVEVYDDSAADDVIDALVITGGASNASVTVVDGTSDAAIWDIERILSDDDVSLNSFEFEGEVVGDDAAAGVDVWFDSGLRTLELGGYAGVMAGTLNGQIGGDVSTLAFGSLGSGNLTIGGEVRRFDLDASSDSPIFGTSEVAPSGNVTALNFSPGGVLYTFDGTTGLLQTTTGGTTSVRVDVTDTLGAGIDIDPGETVTVSLRDGDPDITINLSGVYDVQDLIDAFNEQSFRLVLDGSGNPVRDASGQVQIDTSIGDSGQLVRASLNADGNALVFEDLSTNNANPFRIRVDDPTSDLATVLGLDVTDGGVGEGAADGDTILGRELVPGGLSTSLSALLGQTFSGTQRVVIDLQDGSSGLLVDLTGQTTVEGVARAIEDQTDQRVKVLLSSGSRLVLIDQTTGAGTFAVADAVGGLATALGIEAVDGGGADNDAIAGRITGTGVISTATTLAALDVNLSGNEILSFDLGDGQTGLQINLTNFTVNTIGDLQDVIANTAGANGLALEVQTGADGERFLRLVDNGGGAGVLRASDLVGTLLTDLGLAGFDGGPTDADAAADDAISGSPLLGKNASLVDTGLLFTGDQTLDVDLTDGSTVGVTLTGVTTLKGVINAFETAGVGGITAGFDVDGRLVLLDNLGGGNPFAVTETAGDAGVALGLLPPGGPGAADGLITTLPITEVVTSGTRLADLGIGTADQVSITLNLRNGNQQVVDLADATTVEEVIVAINSQTNNLVSAQLAGGGRLALIDNSTGANAFTVSDNVGILAVQMGINATDGIANDTDGRIDGVIVGQTMLESSTRLSTLGIDPAGGAVDIDFRDGTTLTNIDLSGATTLVEVRDALAAATSNRVSFTITADGRLLMTDSSSGGGGTFSISDNGASTIARDLGIARTADSPADGDILGGQLLIGGALPADVLTSLSGAHGFDINVRSGGTISVAFTDANTFGEVIDAINTAASDSAVRAADGGNAVVARITADGRVVLTDRTTGPNAFGLVDGAGTPVADLGLTSDNSLAANVILGDSLFEIDADQVNLADFGISIEAGDSFTITQTDGDDLVVTFGVAPVTLQDLIDEVDTDTSSETVVSLGAEGRLVFTDALNAGVESYRVFTATTDTGNVLEQLGIEASDGGFGDTDGGSDDVIQGTSVFLSSSRLSEVGVAGSGAEEIAIGLADGSRYIVDLSDAVTVGDVITAIESQTNDDVSVVISGSDRLLLTDETAGAEAFTVANLSGSPASDLGILVAGGTTGALVEVADDLGLAIADGDPGDGSAAGDGVILGPAVFGGGFTLSSLGIDPSGGEVLVTFQDGSTATIDLSSATSIADVATLLDAGSGSNLTVTVSNDGRLVITDGTAGGTTFSIADTAGSTIAADLGIAVVDGSADDTPAVADGVIGGDDILASALTLASVGIDPAGANLDVTLRDGTTPSIDISGALTVEALATALGGSGITLTVTVNGELQLVDGSAGGSTFAIADTADAILGRELVSKLDLTDPLSFPDVGAQIDAGVDLRIQLRDGGPALNISLTDLRGDATLSDLVDQINSQAVRYSTDINGVRTVVASGLVTASIDASGRLVLTDNTTGFGAFEVRRTSATGGLLVSNAMADLGLTEGVSVIDGGVDDNDGSFNGVIVGDAIPGASSADVLLSAIRSQVVGLDNDGGTLYALMEGLDTNPSEIIGSLFTTTGAGSGGLPQSLDVAAMAANSQGEIYAVVRVNGGSDTLVRVNATTGQAVTLGLIENNNGTLYEGHVEALAFTPDGQLLTVVSDADGVGSLFNELQGQAIGVMDLSDTDGDGRVTLRRLDVDVTGAIDPIGLPLQNVGGILANQLGLATTDNNALRDGSATIGTILGRDLRQSLTGLEDIEADLGVTLGGGADLTITIADSTLGSGGTGIFNVDLNDALLDVNNDGIRTLNEALSFITEFVNDDAGQTVIGASLSSDGRGIIIQDFSLEDDLAAPSPLTLADAGASDVATLLGVAFTEGTGSDRDGVANQILQGRDIRLAATDASLLTDLGITSDFNRLMSYTLRSGASGVIDLTAATTLGDVRLAIDGVAGLTATIESPTQTVAGLNERITSALQVVDGSVAAPGNTFTLGAGPVDVAGIAVNSQGEIFAVLSDNLADTDRLVTIDPSDRSVRDAGLGDSLIKVDPSGANTDTDIAGIGFDASDQLFAFDFETKQVLLLDTDVTTVAEAVVVDENIGPDPDGDIEGFFVDASGGRHGTLFYAFDLVDGDNNLVNENANLLVSGGFGPIFGTVDPTNGEFTRAASVDGGARALAFDSIGATAETDAFIVTGEGRLVQVNADPLDDEYGGLIADLGRVRDAITNQLLTITAIDFDETSNLLVGLDATRGRLVSIELVDSNGDGALDAALASGLLQNGALNAASFTSLGYNPDPTVLGIEAAGTNGEIVPIVAAGASGTDRLLADSFSRVTIDGDFSGRVQSTGNTVGSVRVDGDFGGLFESNTEIRNFTQTSGDFSGVLSAGDEIGRVNLRNAMTSGSIVADEAIKNLTIGGDFAGEVITGELGTMRVSGAAASGSVILADELRSVNFRGVFDGSLTVGDARSLRFDGLGANAEILVGMDVTSFRTGDTADGSSVVIEGAASTVRVDGTHAGQIATQGEVRSASFRGLDGGLFLAGTDLGRVTVSGDVSGSLISAGVWLGADGVYNTADDQIYGGVIDRVMIRGDYINSAIVAGVLPSEQFGPGIPTDLQAYTGQQDRFLLLVDDLAPVDSAEAGGLLESGIGMVSFGQVLGAGAGSQQASVVAAAGTIGDLRGTGVNLLITREYIDRMNAPTVVSSGFFAPTDSPLGLLNTTAFVQFSEQVLSSSLVLSQDTNNDGDLLDVDDVRGSVVVFDPADGNRILDSDDGLQLALDVIEDTRGNLQTVLYIVGFDGFSGTVEVSLSGSQSDQIVLDRSGLRSLQRDADNNGIAEVGEDAAGTIFDGDSDGVEGGGSSILALQTIDVANDFGPGVTFGGFTQGVGLNQPASTVTSVLETADDIDIFSFDANAFEFVSVELDVLSTPSTSVGLFYRDTQGTDSQADDTYELVTEWTFTPAGSVQFGAELTESGEYFVAVAGFSGASEYNLSVARSTTDTGLLTAMPGLTVQDIAYTSNTLGENGNQLGFNSPKQLVYLNFDGGVAESFDGQDVSFAAFDARQLEDGLAGFTQSIIDQAVDAVLSIYQNIPTGTTQYDGNVTPTLNVANIGANLSTFGSATSGLFFTTFDPDLVGFSGDYTELFIGEAFFGGPGLLGIAESIDGLNMTKDDRALVFTQNFAGFASAVGASDRAEQYARAIGNVTAHELGHILGFNHSMRQLLGFDSQAGRLDDPDNDPSTLDNSNSTTAHLMSAGPNLTLTDFTGGLLSLGTSDLEPSEFPVGDIDTVDMVLRALA